MKKQILKKIAIAAIGGFLSASPVSAATLNINSTPLFLGTSIDPNVFFMIDDSGSMDFEVLTGKHWYYSNYWFDAGNISYDDGYWHVNSTNSSDSCNGAVRRVAHFFSASDNLNYGCAYTWLSKVSQGMFRDWRGRSADFSSTYYDPSVTYLPWPGMPDASFSAARSDPQPASSGYSVIDNLAGFVYERWFDDRGFTGTFPSGPDTANTTPNSVVDIWDSHTRYTLSSAQFTIDAYSYTPNASATCGDADLNTSPPFVNCLGTSIATTTALFDSEGRTVAEAQQNVANWYQYHRRRSFVTKNAVATVINNNANFRFGLSVINSNATLFTEMPSAGVTDYTSHNASLLDDFFSFNWPALGTPLRRGLEVAGRYYTSNSGQANFGKTDPITATCQQNFSVLFTDGHYNGGSPLNTNFAIGDADADGKSVTVADVAMAYYENDLSNLADFVPTTPSDPEKHQHMVTFTVAFGVTGELIDTDNDGWPNTFSDGTDMDNPLQKSSPWWTSTGGLNQSEKIDDLWHAAFNSTGEFLSASSPSEVTSSLDEALNNIADRTASAAAVALNSGSLNSTTHVYQARFNSEDWSGELLAYGVNADGSVNSTPTWNAGSIMDAQPALSRVILTTKPSTGAGVAFRFPANHLSPASNELDASQVTSLLTYADNANTTAEDQTYGEAVVDYLRGVRTHESSTSSFDFRERGSVLGDIIHSAPLFMKNPSFRYNDVWRDARYPSAVNPESTPTEFYSSFKAGKISRNPIIWVGSNDGMLHGIDADAASATLGEEVLAYIPSILSNKLVELTQENYVHDYYVDGSHSVIDAHINGAWSSVLVGSLAGGGQGVYALDVTNPANYTAANAASIVLWEYDETDDPDIGYTYGRPSIVRLHNGDWAAIFGNGLNNTESDDNVSADGDASLFIINLDDGTLLKKIDTATGSAEDPLGLSRPNGLTHVTTIDDDNDDITDYAYAGDLFGNVWKFNLTSNNATNWGIDGPATSTTTPIFVTNDGGASGGTPQPITSRVNVGRAPAGYSGVMVYFGTGKYLEVGDNSSFGQQTQTLYGIWDDNQTTATTRSNLFEQVIEEEIVDTNIVNGVTTTTDTRATSSASVDWSVKKGWFIDLINQDSRLTLNNAGERMVSNPLLSNNRIIFTTLVPSADPCEYGGSSWLMALDAYSGSRLDYVTFDLNADGSFNDDDYVYSSELGESVAASGTKSKVGIIPTPSILGSGGYAGGAKRNEYWFSSGSTGDLGGAGGNDEGDGKSSGNITFGRQAWRELREE